MASGSSRLLGRSFLYPLYAAAAEHGLPVANYPDTAGSGTSGDPTSADRPTRYFDWRNIIHQNSLGSITSLVCASVFEKSPTLRFVAIEGRLTLLPSLLWRMEDNFKGLHAETPWLKRLPSD
jgi:predicted TIM-barrel fold metal-dependent hydrolase